MKEQRDVRAQNLFEAFNYIDDKLIADAQTPQKAIAYKKARQRFVRSAVAAACVFAVVCSGILHNTLSNDLPMQDSTYDTQSNVQMPSNDSRVTLESTLMSPHSSKKVKKVSLEQIDFFGKTSIIWRVNGEDEYNLVKVDTSISQALKDGLVLSSTALSPQEADEVCVEVWLSLGDGRVVSPYLKNSKGNVGYAELFEYTPEVEPNKEFTNLVNDLIN